jgi:hypothetical protein
VVGICLQGSELPYQRREVADCVLVTHFGSCGPIYGSLIICLETVE